MAVIPPDAAHNASTIPSVTFPPVEFLVLIKSFRQKFISGRREHFGEIEQQIGSQASAARGKESENRQEKKQEREDCEQIAVGQFGRQAQHVVFVNLLPDVLNKLQRSKPTQFPNGFDLLFRSELRRRRGAR